MAEKKKTYKLRGKIASVSIDFETGDITIDIPDGIKIYGVKQHASLFGIQNDRNVYPTEKFIIKEIFIPEETIMENARCFGDRMIINAW